MVRVCYDGKAENKSLWRVNGHFLLIFGEKLRMVLSSMDIQYMHSPDISFSVHGHTHIVTTDFGQDRADIGCGDIFVHRIVMAFLLESACECKIAKAADPRKDSAQSGGGFTGTNVPLHSAEFRFAMWEICLHDRLST